MGGHKKVMKHRRRRPNEVRFHSSSPIEGSWSQDGDMWRYEFGMDMAFVSIIRNKRGHVRKPRPVKQ